MENPTKTTVLYKGTITIDFFGPTPEKPKRHIYIVRETKERPISSTGATGVIDKSRPLMIWAERLAANDLLEKLKAKKKITEEDILTATHLYQTYKQEAADIGTKIHNFAEAWVKHKLKIIKDGPEMPTDEKVLNGAMAFLKWVDEHRVKFIATEQLVYSQKFNFVGLADAIAKINNKNYLIDFKSSNNIYPEYFLQASAYLKADEEESGREYDGLIITKFSKDTGEFETRERTMVEIKKDYKVFLCLLETKKWLKFIDKV